MQSFTFYLDLQKFMEDQTRARANNHSHQRWKGRYNLRNDLFLTLISFPLINVWDEKEGEWKPYNGSTVKLY